MFFTCSPMCSDPTHQHSTELEFATESQNHLADITIAGLQKKSKGKAEKSGKKTHLVSAKGKMKPKASDRIISKNSKGKLKVVDIHCHYLNPEVAKKTESLGAANYDTSIIFANDLTRQTNAKQMADRASKLTGIDERIRDMDKMGIDIQAVCPAPFQYFYFLVSYPFDLGFLVL